MKTVAIVQARMGSTRLPGKVMMKLGVQPVLAWVVNACTAVPEIDETIVATSWLEADQVIADYCLKYSIPCYRGSETLVLDRMYQAAKKHGADIVLRLTADCPFLDSNVIAEVIRLYRSGSYDYASNIDPPTYPDGLDVECFSFKALEAAWKEAVRESDWDCVPQFIVRNRDRFPSVNLRCPLPGLEKERWVLDTGDDLEFCRAVLRHLPPFKFGYLDILRALDRHPELRDLNQTATRNERFYDHIYTERLPRREFPRSEALFKRAISTIPFGAQTFSKSHIQFPPHRSPLYVSHADGARIFDVDGHDYVDLVGAVLPVVLGYRDPDVDQAIRTQLDQGISFSLATKLESELSELLCHHIPCAEMTKFGKSGTDVTTAAIRLARAYTGREMVLASGYHGWADWSMAPTDRNLGIPIGVKHLTHRLTYGDYAAWTRHLTPMVAAVIVEPDGNAEFLDWLKRRCREVGAVLIFDEIITGFRLSMGGAQKLYGVTPDLATFAKAMANGMPISALVGSRDIMKRMQPPDNIFYSGTMFGETLSIAAAIATIKKLERCKVVDHLWAVGDQIEKIVRSAAKAASIDDWVVIDGVAPRKMISFRDHPNATANQIRTLYMQEMIQNGVLVINSHNISFAIREPEIKRIKLAYQKTFAAIADGIRLAMVDKMIGEEASTVAPLRAAR